MKVKKYIVFCLAVLLLAACRQVPQAEVQAVTCATMPNGGVASARACAMDGKAYVFAGRDKDGVYQTALWEYDPKADTWGRIADVPGPGRVNASIAAVNGTLYLGLGYAGNHAYVDSCYLQDWWSYTPATNQWKHLADFPNRNTVAAVMGADGSSVYALFGCGYVQQSAAWQYLVAEDRWVPLLQQKHKGAAFGCTGTMHRGLLYMGTGFNAHNLTDWYSVALPDNHWEPCSSLPGKGREFSTCASDNRYIYLFGGQYFGGDMTGGEIFDSYMRYSPDANQWEWCGRMPCGRAVNQIAFAIDGKVYFGLGENEKGTVLNGLYCIEK